MQLISNNNNTSIDTFISMKTISTDMYIFRATQTHSDTQSDHGEVVVVVLSGPLSLLLPGGRGGLDH